MMPKKKVQVQGTIMERFQHGFQGTITKNKEVKYTGGLGVRYGLSKIILLFFSHPFLLVKSSGKETCKEKEAKSNHSSSI